VLAIGAVLAAESGSHESYLDTAGSAIIAICLYWLAHAYADVLGHRLRTHERLNIAALGRALRDEATILMGSALPLLALLLCWAFGVALTSGVEAALWTSVGSLIAFELLAGIRARSTPRELVLEVGVGATMGLAIVALKVILH
jgi:membrane protein YqaA with SNARE-associated domain